jgi:amino acid adenylation domain-containing protein/non-ribosomal peptide synthase protein (TIGR01720 family)
MLRDSGVALLLTQQRLAPRLPAPLGLRVLALDAEDMAAEPVHAPDVALHADNLAYLIYTSGSTGRPKGVAMPHGVVAQLALWQMEKLPGALRTLMFASPCFDVSFQEIMCTLAAGGQLVQTAEDDRRDFSRLLALAQRHAVQRLYLPFAVLQLFAEAAARGPMPHLAQIITAGEQLKMTRPLAQWMRTEPQCRVINQYGPTESHVVSDFLVDDLDEDLPPIGRPASAASLLVLDGELRPAPMGVAGELAIGGAALARGYLGRAALTAERFVADPTDAGGGRLYRTGDLVRWRADGELEYLGRIDHQVKVRGFRIEPGEIENRLLADPQVREAVVLARPRPEGARLVAYVCPQPGAQIDIESLRANLARALPDYMVPSALVALASLPLNANGKVDRNALPEPEFADAADYAEPEGALEQMMARLWAEALGVERVGRFDNFFALGGHSLLALRLAERLRAEGWPVPVKTLFAAPRLADFAAAVRLGREAEPLAVPPNLIPVDCARITPEMLTLVELDENELEAIAAATPGGAANIQDIYPLAPLQEGILFHHLMQTEGDVYIVTHALAFDSRARLDGFMDSLRQVVARHDILRTAILWEGLREPVQVVLRRAPLDLEALEQAPAGSPGEDADVVARLAAHVRSPDFRIDIRRAPMIRALALFDSQKQRWLLQLASHHLTLDHTTLELLLDEIALLQQQRAGELAASVPFRRFVAQARLSGSRREHEAFFRDMLGDVVEPTTPFGLRDVQGDGRGMQHLHMALPGELSRRLRRLAQANGVSAATLFHLAWAMVVANATGRSDVVFGTVLFGRLSGADDAGRALGLFINTLPIRVRFGAQGVRTLLRQTHDTLTGLLHHEHAGLSLAQRCSGLPGGVPLFSALLNYRYSKARGERARHHWQGVEMVSAGDGTNYPFSLSVDDLEEDFGLIVHVAETIGAERIGAHVDAALRLMAETLEAPGDAPLPREAAIPRAERDALARLGAPDGAAPAPLPLHRLIERQAAERGDAAALIHGETILRYRDLERRANRLAHRLIASGAGPESRVGVLLERSPAMIVSLLAVWKAGAAYVPLDPRYPDERLRDMAEDSGIGWLVTQPDLRARAAAWGARVLMAGEQGAGRDDAPPQAPAHPQSLAYIIYTSGSTGRPKGVAVAHGALSMHIQAVSERFGLRADDRFLHFASFGFDAAGSQWMAPLACGAAVALLDEEQRAMSEVAAVIRRHRVSAFHLTPAYLRLLAEEMRGEGASVRLCIAGGEAWSREDWRLARAVFSPEVMANSYGPTEAVISPCVWAGAELPDDAGASAPIGRPVGRRLACVLDDQGNRAPPGVTGELYLGGEGLARAYHGRPGLTAERFVADPFDAAGGRLYRTGDLARWNAQGELEFEGRADEQIKIRGLRIEPGEIAARLLQQPEIRQAAVTARPGAGGERLVAYVAPREGQTVEAAELTRRLERVLPDYMVPADFVVLAALPLTPNGKVDRRALPAPERLRECASEAPQGAAECMLAEIWSSVLGVEGVGREDNFFALGGDSILSLQIVSRARARGWKVTPRQLFERQSIARLAAVVEPSPARLPDGRGSEPPKGDAPLLPIQMDFFDLPIPARHHWNQSLLLEPNGPLDVPALRRALAVLARHHDSLRLRFAEEAGVWRQSYAPPEHIEPDELLWTRRADTAADVPAICEEAQRSLDLARAPLLRAVAIEVADNGWRVLLALHHLVVDGVSWRILLEDLQIGYAAYRAGREPELAPATTTLQAWSRALLAYPAGHREELAWWRRLAGAPAALPYDDPSGADDAAHHAAVEVRLDAEQTEALLHRAPAAYRTQVNDILLTALGRALCDWSGVDRILIDLEGHGREDIVEGADLSRTIGWFTTIFPVLLEPCGAPGEALRRVKEMLRQIPNRGVGHGLFKHYGDPEQRAALAALPRAEASFNYLGQFDRSFERSAWRPAEESAGAAVDAAAPRKHALAVTGQVYGGELALSIAYSRGRHESETIVRLAARLRRELEALIAHCVSGAQGLTPSDVPLARLSQEQLDRLPASAAELVDLYPLSPIQSGMLFHSMSEPEKAVYVTQLEVEIEGLDAPRFRQAWQTVLDRHAVLRTGFLAHVEPPMQWVARQAPAPLTEYDYTGLADQAAALRSLAEEQHRPFDLARPPLLRLALARLAPRRHHLVFTHHHLLSDGWSASMLLGEVLSEYSGRPRAAAVGSFRDYIAWLQGRDAAASECYWRAEAERLPEPTILADALRPPRDGEGYGEVDMALDQAETRALVEFARRERVTPNTLVQGAWALLLARYAGQRVVAFGATVAGRPAELPGVEHMLGNFINTVPVIVAQDGGRPLGDWLRALQAQNLAIREHEQTPLADIQRWAGQGGRAMFDSIIVFENYPVDAALAGHDDAELKFRAVKAIDVTTFPMDVEVHLGSALRIRFIHQRRFFGREATEAIARGLFQLLRAMSAPQHGQRIRTLRDLSLLDEAEQGALLRLGRGGAPIDPAYRSPAHRRIEEQAARRGDAVALATDAEELSYAVLDARANRLARRLQELGVGPGAIVAVAMERSAELIVALLAALKTGAAYLPLDIGYPADRLAFMIRDSGAGCLVAHRAALAKLRLPEPPPQVVVVDDLDLEQGPADDLSVDVHPQDLAYVIYTSGSTGLPKGVAVPHGPLAMHCQATADIYGMSPQSCELHFMSFSFDGAHERWLTALSVGARLVLRGEELWTAEQAYDALHRHGVTNAAFPPAYLGQIADWASRRDDPPPVELYVFGGEAMPKAPYDAIRRHLRPRALINGYGPTETVVTPLIWKAGGDETFDGAYAPIGRPVGERAAYILDDEMQPTPENVVGELYIGGYGLARGYLGRPGLSAERFVADPFDAEGGRLYRTGDLARWTTDGNVEFVGRSDHQVKIRGFRIELGEIEARLLEADGVTDAAVVALEGAGGRQLVAYVAPRPCSEAPSDLSARLRQALSQRLPDYMVPAHIVTLAALPRLISGKLDRAELPAPQTARAGHVAPKGPQAEALAAIWQETLGCGPVGMTDNFFELGGDSLLSLKVIARVRQLALPGLDIKLRDLIRRPTIGGLLGLDEGEAPSCVVRLEDRGPGAPLFCLHAGAGTVFDYQPLARSLRGVRPVHGVACRMLADPSHQDTSLRQMAADYVGMIRRVQPRGPYLLMGWSLGGALAALAAAELEAAGEELAFLGLVDPFVPEAQAAAAADDWGADLRVFIGMLWPDARIADDDPRAAGEGPDVDRLAQLFSELVARRDPRAPDSAYLRMGGEELASTFIVAQRLKALSSRSGPLPPLRAQAHVWWREGRLAPDRRALAAQLGGLAPTCRDIPSDHFGVMRDDVLIAAIGAVLAEPGDMERRMEEAALAM